MAGSCRIIFIIMNQHSGRNVGTVHDVTNGIEIKTSPTIKIIIRNSGRTIVATCVVATCIVTACVILGIVTTTCAIIRGVISS